MAKKAELARTIGFWSLFLYGVGDILGAGIYGLVGRAAGEMGRAVWLGFLVSMVAAGLTGLSYASLGSRYPKAAGAVFSVARAYKNGFVSYVVGMALLASGLTSMATASRAFAGYFSGLVAALPMPLIIVGFALALTLIVFWGIKESLYANALCTLIELTGLVLVIGVGASYLGSVNYLDATTTANPTGDVTFPLIMGGAVLTFYSFVGFEDIMNVAEEVKNPQRNLPLALLLAVAVASAVYILISLVAVSVMSPAELSGSKQPLVDVVARAAPWFPTPLFSAVALFAVANTALLNFIMGSRLLYGMSNQGLFPAFFSAVHSRRRSPHRSVILVGLLLVALAFSGDISTLAKATSVLLLLCFTLVNSALVVLHKDRIRGSFEVPRAVPVLGALVCVALLTQSAAAEWIVAGSLLALITVLYFLMRPSAKALDALGTLD